MIRRSLPRNSSIRIPLLIRQGYYSTASNSNQAPKLTADVIRSSVKEFTTLLSSSEPDEATQPIDTAPIFKDPRRFTSISCVHQGQVIQELQTSFDLPWHQMLIQLKQLAYFIAYGDWGSREKFANWREMLAPLDLPFSVPSEARVRRSNGDTVRVRRLKPVVLADTPVRGDQFRVRRIDSVTKFFVYLAAFIAMAAIWRDKTVGEKGIPVERTVQDPYMELYERELEEARVAQEKEQTAETSNRRKWYYLWLSR